MFKKAANQGDIVVAQNILDSIYKERPDHWPNGLTARHFDGGLYLIQKQANATPVGFVGWQEREEDGKSIGYYSVGVLPEHRRSGFAKEAVAQLIEKKAGTFSEVKALIVKGNKASKVLADSVGASVLEKSANTKAKLMTKILGGILTPTLLDAAVNKDKGAIGYALGNEGADPWSVADFLINAGAGATGKLPYMALAAGKTVATPAVRNMAQSNDTFDRLVSTIKEKEFNDKGGEAGSILKDIPKEVWMGAGGLGLAALGLNLYKHKKNSDLEKDQMAIDEKGRVRITLPTKQKGDAETTIDMPLEEIAMSKALRSRLGRDARRRLYSETKARTKKRTPKDSKNPTDVEAELIDLHNESEELDKTAAAAPTPGVPTPPIPGQNPAMRMQQQQATANSIQPQTAANPQIAEAQQAAESAAMQAQQEAASMEQQTQQQIAEVQSQADTQVQEMQGQLQQQTAQAKQEKDILELNLAKEKAKGELQKVTGSGAPATKDDSHVSSRLGRISNKLSKMAAVPLIPTMPAAPTTPEDPQGVNSLVAPTWAQNINDSPDGGQAVGLPSYLRTSLGGFGDSVMGMLRGSYINKPTNTLSLGKLGKLSVMNHPDKIKTIQHALGDEMFKTYQNQYQGLA